MDMDRRYEYLVVEFNEWVNMASIQMPLIS